MISFVVPGRSVTACRAGRGGLCAVAALVTLGVTVREAAASSWQPKALYIARHGQTAWNRVGRTQGDPDLDPRGYEDRVSLMLALGDVKLERVYTSAMLRTRRTAALIAEIKRLTPTADPALNELRSGVFEGICWTTMAAEEADASADRCRPAGAEAPAAPVASYLRAERTKRHADKANYRPPGGESYRDGHQRVGQFLARQRAALETRTTLIVAHQGTNRLLLSHLMGWPLEQVVRIPQHNDWIYKVARSDEGSPRLSIYRDGKWRRCLGRPDPAVGLECTR